MFKNDSSIIRVVCVIILLSSVCLASSCSEDGSVDVTREKTSASGERTIRVVFRFPGDDIGASEHRTILNRITDSIRSRGAGEIASSGFGMGTMEITIRIQGEEGLRKIKEIIHDTYPEADYRITKSLLRP